jgi:hypothetical protein
MSYASIKIPAAEMAQVRAAAAVQSRSVSSQVVHWIRLGQAFERDPNVGFIRVEQALKAQISVDQLNGAEQETYFDELEKRMDEPSELENQFFADRVTCGLGVGVDDDGNLITGAQALSDARPRVDALVSV